MNISALDLNLIPLLHQLLTEVHVSRAAERAGLSQPAMSHALNRMRGLLGDPLLVRGNRGMVLTPMAQELKAPVARIVAKIQHTFLEREAFDPRTWQGRVRIGADDFSELEVITELAGWLQKRAPGMQINGLITSQAAPFLRMARGDMDLALGYFPECPPHFYRKSLFPERFVCLVRKGHPQISDHIALEQYAAMGHVLVSPGGEPHGVVDHHLRELGLQRTVQVVVAHFLAAPAIVANSDLICTLPERMAKRGAKTHEVRLLEPPLPVQGFQLHLVWHQRTHGDQPLTWLRAQIGSMTAQKRAD